MTTAAARWRRLVRARLTEAAELSPDGAADTPEFWDARARRFAARCPAPARRDPLLTRVRRSVGGSSTVADVGTGTGRFALALAPRVREVVAVDPSQKMLGHVRRRTRVMGLDNVRLVLGRWQDVAPLTVDVGICSYVLPSVEDAAGFLAKLDRACRNRVFVYLGAMSSDAVFDPFWRHFHGKPRRPGPTYLDAVAVLAELGLEPLVEVVEVPTTARFANVAAAVDDYREQLLLPDNRDVRRELRALLSPWLVERGSELGPPVRAMPAAVISWDGHATDETVA